MKTKVDFVLHRGNKIIWEEETYTYIDDLKDYKRCDGRLLIGNMDLLTNHLEDEVEILDSDYKENKPITKEDIEAVGYAMCEIQKSFKRGWEKSMKNEPLEDKEIEYEDIDGINKLPMIYNGNPEMK